MEDRWKIVAGAALIVTVVAAAIAHKAMAGTENRDGKQDEEILSNVQSELAAIMAIQVPGADNKAPLPMYVEATDQQDFNLRMMRKDTSTLKQVVPKEDQAGKVNNLAGHDENVKQ